MKTKTTNQMSKKRLNKEIPDELPVQPLSKMSENRSYVFYGRSGTGKTTLAMSFPRKVLLLDVKDRGTDSVAHVDPKQGVGMRVEDWDDFEMVYYYLKKNPDKYGSVVIDTMSQLQQLCVQRVLEDSKKSADNAGNWGSMTRREWGEVASIMKEWIILYRDLTDIGIEVIFIAQDRVFNAGEEEVDPENMLSPEIGPRLSPSVAAHLNAAVSVVGNTFIREKTIKKEVNGKKKESQETQYCLRIGPNPVYVTKVRKPKNVRLRNNGIIVDPDFDKIINILEGEE